MATETAKPEAASTDRMLMTRIKLCRECKHCRPFRHHEDIRACWIDWDGTTEGEKKLLRVQYDEPPPKACKLSLADNVKVL